ncbi:hypothetical protein [Mesorhizobium sp. M7A.F.Ce.TU.012.03.2.1]|uniref:hypothetical protein n=1 Tax=Mesorhizobium sp. M7A.F.Ce.TU.012.03.2.1 TaxID=2493681 RepID=UPI000FDCABC5|nr:hypothetical protein [Mesorhizobium sp. M7A.F.Ce.TU.012.03.2.1]AZV21589.1 hypothetical protein EJ079_22385 [Mesorhizobium sp. M7A.F.Ce.TU.012.03.2.1]
MPIKKRNLFPHQKGLNGPLDEPFKKRLQRIRNVGGLTYDKLGQKLGISGSFASNLLQQEAHTRTVHIPRYLSAVEQLERELGIVGGEAITVSASVPQSDPISLEGLIRYANSQGFAVTFTPIDPRMPADA